MKVNRSFHQRSGFHWDSLRLMLTMSAFLVILSLQASAKGFLANGNGVPPLDKVLTGKVVGPENEPLVGATVTVVGKNISAVTSADGSFKISLPTGSRKISVSSVGFTSKEVTVGDNDKNILVKLEVQVNTLNDVVVTSMGIQKQAKSIGYATTVIKASELVQTAPTNFATALYGKAPGVRIAAAPGGSTSGVAIQIRGLNSITGRTQPLIIMDGVPIHDGDFNNNNYWGDQRARGNALTDLNPEDIESITVLKGASAAALYGSEATNGVIMITTKTGRGKKGFSVDAGLTYFQDKVAYLPRLQNVRGAGSPVQYDVYGEDANGFNSTKYTVNGTQYRALVQGSLNFGPVFDGQPIVSWDGVVRPYSPQKNGWANLFQTAKNVVENVAFSNVSDNSNTRFSVTHQHYEGVSINSLNDKYTFNLNSTYNFGKKLKVNFVINDIYANVQNRPYLDDRLINNFGGMLPTFDNGDWYKARYQTSLGYRYVTGTNPSLTPSENLTIPNRRGDILDYMWNVNKNTTNEINNRLIASATAYWDVAKNLQFRGKIATDYTTNREEDKSYSTQPIVFGPSGSYGISTYNYSIFYGDLLLTYNKKINKDLELKAMAGYNADKESSYTTSLSTNGGLTTENRFDLSSSSNPNYYTGSRRGFLTKDAFIGTINANYKNYFFVEGTVRRDRTSTMNPNNNSFVYPSFNAALVLSDLIKMPSYINYVKVRGAWGIVGNYPGMYLANVAYNLGNLGVQGVGSSVLTTTIPTGTFGNDGIRPEKKHETELGLEAKMLNSRLSIDLAYYFNRTKDMILPLSIAQSSGAGSILTNVGTLRNTGFEFSVQGTPVQGRNFTWQTGVNFNTNHNVIEQLSNGSSEIIHADYDGNAAVLKSVVGNAIGDLYAHPILTDASGNKVIADLGNGEFNYQIDGSKLVNYGNTQVKAIGGFFNNFKYKNFSLELYTDFRIGGYVMPTGLNWMTSRGLTEESLTAMDAAHGGISYYKDAQGRGIQTSAAQGPNGEKVYNDGIKMGGVFPNGTPNNYVTSQFYYYWDTYNWGGPQYSNSQYFKYIVENTYWKMREVTLSYNLPQSIARKIKATKLQVSVFGRNLFYLYRTIKDMDAEQLTTGLSWMSNVNNAGTQPSTRSFGVSLKASF